MAEFKAPQETLPEEHFPVDIGGKTYKCGHISASDRAALRAYIRQQRIEAVKQSCFEYSGEVFSSALAKTAALPIYETELFSVMGSEEGIYFMLWRGVRRYHPEMTIERVRQAMDAEAAALIARRQWELSGYGEGEAGAQHATPAAVDYDLDHAIILRYYPGIRFEELMQMSARQVGRLIELIPEVRKKLGEGK